MFHKSCYTSRSSGYKYRTLSTNTGEKKRRDSQEDNTVDKAFKEIRREISTRVNQEFDEEELSREKMFERFEKIDSKINFLLELQEDVLAMRQKLISAESAMADMIVKVQKIEAFTSEPYSLKSRKSSFRSRSPVVDKKEEREIRNEIAAATA